MHSTHSRRLGGAIILVLVFAASATIAQEVNMTSAALIEMSKEVQKEVEQLRGWKFKRKVNTDVYTEDQLRKFIEKRLFEEDYGDGRLEQLEAMLRMTGLIPADCDLRKTIMEVLLNQIGGFYDPPTQTFYMLNRAGVDYGPFVNRMLVAHELTHALDDQYVDLDKLMKSRPLDEDWALAMGAVIEGSATVLMQRYAIYAQKTGKYDLSELSAVAETEMKRARVFLEAPRYFTTLMANYLCGMHFITRGKLDILSGSGASKAMQANVLAATSNPPTSSEQILHPQKYWDEQQRDDPVLVVEEDIIKLLEAQDANVIHRNTIGEMLCAVLTTPDDEPFDMLMAAVPSYWTNEAATGWGGDRFFLLGDKPTRKDTALDRAGLRGLWITVWDSHNDRDEFVEDYLSSDKINKSNVLRFGMRGAVFFYGFSDADKKAFTQRFHDAPPKFTRAAKPWLSLDDR